MGSHRFSDVPNTNTFHADITWLADMGITRGCNPPANTEFCPKDPVTREQMAAFMRRLADRTQGRIASNYAAWELPGGVVRKVVDIEISAPGSGGGLAITGYGTFIDDLEIALGVMWIERGGTSSCDTGELLSVAAWDTWASGSDTASSNTGLPVGTSRQHIKLCVEELTGIPYIVGGELTATWVPAGPSGGAFTGQRNQVLSLDTLRTAMQEAADRRLAVDDN
jgi:hypothetical protein